MRNKKVNVWWILFHGVLEGWIVGLVWVKARSEMGKTSNSGKDDREGRGKMRREKHIERRDYAPLYVF